MTLMTDRKDDDDGNDVKNWAAPLTFHFSKPANDNQSPLKRRLIVWAVVAVGLGSLVALLVM